MTRYRAKKPNGRHSATTLSLVLVCLLVALVSWQAPAQEKAEEPLVRASLLSEAATVAPGSTFRLGVRFRIAKDWGIYWRNSGSTGIETALELDLPDGLEAGEILWPGPQRKESPGGLLDYVYHEETMLIVPIAVSESLQAGSEVRIGVRADWLVCKESCVLGGSDMTLTLPVAKEVKPSEHVSLFKKFEKRLPVAPEKFKRQIDIAWEKDVLVIHVPGARRLAFFPHASDDWKLLDPIQSGAAAAPSLRLPIRFSGDDAGLEVTGVLAVMDKPDADPEDAAYVKIRTARTDGADHTDH